MTKMYWEADANADALKGKTIAVLGYGSQGRAHAMNLRDSGCDVVLGLRKDGKTWKQAQDEDGWTPKEPKAAVAAADVVVILTPDMAQPDLFNEFVAPNLKDGGTVLFAHGFNIHYKQIQPKESLDVVMIAPKGPGGLVRRTYEEGNGVPCLLAVHQNASGKAFDTGCIHLGKASTEKKVPASRNWGKVIILDKGGMVDSLRARPLIVNPKLMNTSKPIAQITSILTTVIHPCMRV